MMDKVLPPKTEIVSVRFIHAPFSYRFHDICRWGQ